MSPFYETLLLDAIAWLFPGLCSLFIAFVVVPHPLTFTVAATFIAIFIAVRFWRWRAGS